MGLRFQKRVRLFPGCHLNLSASGVGMSFGGRGAHFGITARGQRYTSIGLPGTGLSFRQYEPRKAPRRTCELCQPGHRHLTALDLLVVLGVIGVIVWAAARV
jgi:hypothetical protein